jgi:hypothetical protein
MIGVNPGDHDRSRGYLQIDGFKRGKQGIERKRSQQYRRRQGLRRLWRTWKTGADGTTIGVFRDVDPAREPALKRGITCGR